MKRLAISAFIVLAVVALLDPVGHNRSEHTVIWAIQGAAAPTAIIILCIYLWIFHKEIKPPDPRKIGDIAAVPDDEAYELQKVAGRINMSAMQARILALAILEPGELRQRVVEHYKPSSRTLDQEVTVEAKIPMKLLLPAMDSARPVGGRHAITGDEGSDSAQAEAGLLFPILVIPKGVFNDNLEVSGPGGDQIPILTYREYLRVTAGMLRLLLCLGYGISTTNDTSKFPRGSGEALDTDPVHLEYRALCEIMKRAKAALDVKMQLGTSPVAPEADKVAGKLEALPLKNEELRIYLKMAAALVRRLSLHYALVAIIDLSADRRLVVKYKRTLIPELELSSAGKGVSQGLLRSSYRRVKGWLRVLFGARPVNVTVSLDNAWTCRSYHVQVEAPESLYLARQKLIASEKYMAKIAEGAATPPHHRFRRRLGQSYAHFYGRSFPIPLPDERRPKIQLEFYQVPPGSDFRAAIASTAAFMLIWIVGFVLSRNGNLGTDAPALLLVFPGIAASWLGFDTITHQLFEGTLAARLSLALTTLISLAASGAFILSKSALPPIHWNVPDNISVLGVYRWPWAILLVVSFANTLYMGCRWLRHSWRFKHLADRPDPDEES